MISGCERLDFIRLAAAPLTDILAELTCVVEAGPEAAGDPFLPAPTTQLADFALAEAVRIVRLGTRAETADAAVTATQFLLTPAAKTLKSRDEEAYTTVNAAGLVLSNAASPASKGAELTILRSWNGKAVEVVRCLLEADRQSMPYRQLQQQVQMDDSRAFGFLLGDLEAGGLAEQLAGHVHAGPVARKHHVRALVGLPS
jgi:hypothetical protein